MKSVAKTQKQLGKIIFNILSTIGLLFFLCSIVFTALAIVVEMDVNRTISQAIRDYGGWYGDIMSPVFLWGTIFAYIIGSLFSLAGIRYTSHIIEYAFIVIGAILIAEGLVYGLIPHGYGTSLRSVLFSPLFALPGVGVLLYGIYLSRKSKSYKNT